MDDRELIAEYVKGSAGAFEALVGRYLGMVYGVAIREVGEHHLAEDVTQAAFALLAKKAGDLVEETVVAGWLFQAVRYAAKNAKKMERRRRFHEGRAGRMRLDETDRGEGRGEEREERMYLLDCALARLGERDRGAVLLRYYRRLEMQEVGKALGVSEGAARRRVERAVGKLRVRMGAVGGGGTGGAAGMVGAMGLAAMKTPAGMAAGALASAQGGAGHETVTVIMKGALKMMFWAKMKVAAVVLASVVVVGGAGTLTVTRLVASPKQEEGVAPPIANLKTRLDTLNLMVKDQQDALDEFVRSNGIPVFREEIQHDYERLAHLTAQVDDAQMRVRAAQRELEAQKGKKDDASKINVDTAQAAYDAQLSDWGALRQERDDTTKKLHDLGRFYSQYETKSADVKALQAARRKLYVKFMVEQAKG